MIEVVGLTKKYGEHVAIQDVSFSVSKGEVVGFLGPNGAGKTTTMRVITGSLGASSGVARVGGVSVAENPKKVQSMLGYAPETPPVYTNMRVKDYVAFAATLKGVSNVEVATKKALERVRLTDVSGRIIDHLSKGYRQRVGLAQALVHDPSVLIFDEPTSGLDPEQRVEIRHLIQELAAGDRTVILSTHVLAEIEAICSRVIVINRGRIVTIDSPQHMEVHGRTVRVEVARDAEKAIAAFRAVPGVSSVSVEGTRIVVQGDRDLREALANAATPFGLLELNGRQSLEDVYLKLVSGGVS